MEINHLGVAPQAQESIARRLRSSNALFRNREFTKRQLLGGSVVALMGGLFMGLLAFLLTLGGVAEDAALRLAIVCTLPLLIIAHLRLHQRRQSGKDSSNSPPIYRPFFAQDLSHETFSAQASTELKIEHQSEGRVSANQRAEDQLGRYEEAIAAYERVLALDPTDLATPTGLGVVYAQLGRYEEAIAAYERALALDPTDPAPPTGLGVVYAQLGRYEEAIAAYERALALDPTDPVPQSRLGDLYARLGRYNDKSSYKISANDRKLLNVFLVNKFTLQELRDIAFELGVDYEQFSNDKKGFCRELILFFERRDTLSCLIVGILKHRDSSVLRRFLELLPPCKHRPKVQIVLSLDMLTDSHELIQSIANLLNLSLEKGEYEIISIEDFDDLSRAEKDETMPTENNFAIAFELAKSEDLRYKAGQYVTAYTLHEQALALWEQALGSSPPPSEAIRKNLRWLTQHLLLAPRTEPSGKPSGLRKSRTSKALNTSLDSTGPQTKQAEANNDPSVGSLDNQSITQPQNTKGSHSLQVKDYRPHTIEPKWQARWAEARVDEPEMSATEAAKNFYNLTMYPYPSGNLHTGHWYAYTGPDIYGRFKRAQGHNVFFPFGYDAFGLPAENAAIKRNIHPAEWTASNMAHMTEQVKRIGAMVDWRAKLATCDPTYYRWNQWFFLKFMERGLAYREFAPVDWCPTCNTTLAREQVKGENRTCERCDTPVIKKELNQWKFRITQYAEQLLDDLSQPEWPERIKAMQRNWIGRSAGGTIRFPVQEVEGETIEVFTTRPDTVFGATFMVLAPEHPLVARVTTEEHRAAVEAYQFQAARQSEIERQATDKEKTGVFTGGYAINPMTRMPIPIWIADYVLMGYGTGAIMAVPGGDERDNEFARKFHLPITPVVEPLSGATSADPESVYTGPGRMINSGDFTGMITLGKFSRAEWGEEQEREYGIRLDAEEAEAKEGIVQAMEQEGIGKAAVTYRLRDWLVSRQRYWGTPIPVIHCPACGIVPVPYDQLPVELPRDVDFRPTGESPLRFHEGFLHTTCPQCGGPAERDTDTMDTFVDSSWYQYRYLSPDFEEGPFDPARGAGWLPVSQYTGGAEHAVMHLLYSRFWTKVMRDMGLVDFDEPFPKLYNQGIILGPDSQKMSKSRGNVVDPDELVAQYGADTVRGYLMFIGPWEQGGPFSMTGIEGISRFYGRVWGLMTESIAAPAGEPAASDIERLERALHQSIQRVQDAYENFSFNVGIAALMEFSNTLREMRRSPIASSPLWGQALDALLIMLAPVAPHITEELWEQRGRTFSIHQQPWPAFDAEKAREDRFELVIQHNGKVRDRVEAPVGISQEEATALALQSRHTQASLGGRKPKKVIYVPGKLVNLVD